MATGFPHGTPADTGGSWGAGGTGGAPPRRPGNGWTAGRIVSVVIGALLALLTLGLLAGGATLLWADQSLRHDGYVTTGTSAYSTTGYALASERLTLDGGWLLTGFIGDVQLRVSSVSPGTPVFVGIGPADRVAAYLAGASYGTVTGTGTDDVVRHQGTARPVPPATAGIWVSQATGTGTQTLRWTPRAGDWMAVAMNPNGSAGVVVRADAGVSAPWLFRLSLELIIGGIVLGAVSAALIIVPLRLVSGAR